MSDDSGSDDSGSVAHVSVPIPYMVGAVVEFIKLERLGMALVLFDVALLNPPDGQSEIPLRTRQALAGLMDGREEWLDQACLDAVDVIAAGPDPVYATVCRVVLQNISREGLVVHRNVHTRGLYSYSDGNLDPNAHQESVRRAAILDDAIALQETRGLR